MLTAIKPKYNAKTRSFDIEVAPHPDVLLAHHGWFVFDDVESALRGIRSGYSLDTWGERKKTAVVQWLEAQTVPA